MNIISIHNKNSLWTFIKRCLTSLPVQPSKDAEEEVEAKKPAMVKNPFFGKEQSSESDSDDDETCSDVDSDDSDCDDTIGSESDSDESKESDKVLFHACQPTELSKLTYFT